MTATDARQQLNRLQAERLDAVDAGLGDNALYMDELESDIASSRVAYVALAVTEIATLRAQLSRPAGRLEAGRPPTRGVRDEHRSSEVGARAARGASSNVGVRPSGADRDRRSTPQPPVARADDAKRGPQARRLPSSAACAATSRA